MTRTAQVVRAELEAVNRRHVELEGEWTNPDDLPPGELGALYVRRDVLRNELAQLTIEDPA